MNRKGRLFVISAPSGSGKTTLCRKLLSNLSGRRKRLVRSVSVTTRRPRKGECEGRDYFFVPREKFIRAKNKGRFLEWAEVLGNFYGTPLAFVREHLNHGDDVLLSIDVQGAMKIKRRIRGAVFIFILPPDFEELKRRLMQRSTEDKKEIARRLKLAKKEMKFLRKYDYVVLNDKLDQALMRLKEIIKTEGKGQKCLMSP